MPRFKFRLKALLELRGTERDVQRAQLAELLTAEQRLRQQKAGVAAELQNELNARRDAVARGRLDVGRLQAAQLFEHALRGELQVLGQRQQALESLVAEQQATLVEAQRQVRVLEKLREKQQLSFDTAQQSAQWRVLDEAGTRQPRQAG